MADNSDDLARAEAIMEQQRTTSAAKEVELGRDADSALEQEQSIQEPFQNAHDDIQPAEQEHEQGQSQAGHSPTPAPEPRPRGAEAAAVDREHFDQRQSDEHQEAMELNQSQIGTEDQNQVGLENDGRDDHDHGR